MKQLFVPGTIPCPNCGGPVTKEDTRCLMCGKKMDPAQPKIRPQRQIQR